MMIKLNHKLILVKIIKKYNYISIDNSYHLQNHINVILFFIIKTIKTIKKGNNSNTYILEGR